MVNSSTESISQFRNENKIMNFSSYLNSGRQKKFVNVLSKSTELNLVKVLLRCQIEKFREWLKKILLPRGRQSSARGRLYAFQIILVRPQDRRALNIFYRYDYSYSFARSENSWRPPWSFNSVFNSLHWNNCRPLF